MPCDLILLNGNVVMNESMLTGESIPVLKNSLPFNNVPYNPNEDGKQYTLFAGTFCIETRYFFLTFFIFVFIEKFFKKKKLLSYQNRFYMKGKIPVLGMVSKTSFSTVYVFYKTQHQQFTYFKLNNNNNNNKRRFFLQ